MFRLPQYEFFSASALHRRANGLSGYGLQLTYFLISARPPQYPPMSANLKFIGEVENAIANGSLSSRTKILGRVTDLFVAGATRLSDEEVALFDDVITRLAVEIEFRARALLSIRLAPIPNAPPRTIRTLAFDDAIEVAAPVLIQSPRLSDSDLVENARIKGQAHLLRNLAANSSKRSSYRCAGRTW